MKWRRCGVVLVLAFASAWGQTAVRAPSIRSTGEGVVQVKPDQAKIDIGVVTQAASAQAAGTENAAQLQSAIAKLKAALGGNAEIKTMGYSLTPVYSYQQNGKAPAIEGYRAMNTVEVTIENLAAVGKVVDAATQGGANEIQQLQFTLQDPAPARAQALRQAVIEARSNAQAMAAAMGLKLGRMISLEQGPQQSIRPVLAMAQSRMAAVATPMEPDVIEVRASVTLIMGVE
jgi:uncharacterized protein YggE